MSSLSSLYVLVEAALVAFPSLAYTEGGSRAEAAATFVMEERINYLGMAEGYDWWQVCTYRTSIKLGRCTCQDRGAPRDDKGRRMCKHFLAACFSLKLGHGKPTPKARRRPRRRASEMVVKRGVAGVAQ